MACGNEASGFAVGDRVFGEVMYGAHASYVCVSAQGAIAKTPAGVSDIDAAALVYGSITAVTFLRTLANVALRDAHKAHACLERGNPGGELVIDLAHTR